MRISVIATSTAHPALFAHALREELSASRPEATVVVRAIQAPAHRRFHSVEADPGAEDFPVHAAEWIDAMRECVESGYYAETMTRG